MYFENLKNLQQFVCENFKKKSTGCVLGNLKAIRSNQEARSDDTSEHMQKAV